MSQADLPSNVLAGLQASEAIAELLDLDDISCRAAADVMTAAASRETNGAEPRHWHLLLACLTRLVALARLDLCHDLLDTIGDRLSSLSPEVSHCML